MKKLVIVLLMSLFIAGCGPDLGKKSEVANGDEVDLKVNSSQLVEQNLPYKNKKHAFGLKEFPKNFEVEQLENDAGIVFKKWVEPPPSKNLKDPSFNYAAEIYVMPFENIENYESISDLVGKKYAGYTFEFADYGKFNGYYVNEGRALNAISHFYAMSGDGETVYEIYLQVPGKYYAEQKEIFENLVKNMVFF